MLQNSLKNTCDRVSFLIKLEAETFNFIKKVSLAQMFSCEFCEISKDTSGQLLLFTPTPVNAPILYFLKTAEKQNFSGVFRRYKIGTLIVNRFIIPAITDQC